MEYQSGADPEPGLTVVSPGTFRGATWHIGRSAVVLGRAPEADLRLEEPTVSRRHARFERQGGRIVLTDLGSSGGTTVNRRPVRGPVELRDGDEVGIASVTLLFRESAAATASLPTTGPRQASYVIDQQQAHQLSNVGGDQYNQYLQTVHQQRDGFLRDIAATRTKARILIWFGLILVVAGTGIFGAVIVQQFADDTGSPQTFEEAQRQSEDFFGPEVGGVPLGIIGWAVVGFGTLILIIGIALHVVATARRRRVERNITPMPPAAFHPN